MVSRKKVKTKIDRKVWILAALIVLLPLMIMALKYTTAGPKAAEEMARRVCNVYGEQRDLGPEDGDPNAASGFNVPRGVALDKVNGDVYVNDIVSPATPGSPWDFRMRRYNTAGTLLGTWYLRRPEDQAFNPSFGYGVAVDHVRNVVYVGVRTMDSSGLRFRSIRRFNTQGEYLGDWPIYYDVGSMELGSNGNLIVGAYLVDREVDHRVLIYAPDGRLLVSFGQRSAGDWSINGPVVGTRVSGQYVYVSQPQGGTPPYTWQAIKKFKLDGTYVSKYEYTDFGGGLGTSEKFVGDSLGMWYFADSGGDQRRISKWSSTTLITDILPVDNNGVGLVPYDLAVSENGAVLFAAVKNDTNNKYWVKKYVCRGF